MAKASADDDAAPDESDAATNAISVESPMAKALLGREEGDEVTVRRPRGTTTFVVEAVRNTPPG